MRAAVIPEENADISFEERDRPRPGPGQVLIRVVACGICHSDVALQEGLFDFATFPRIPGHEVAGVVEELGEGVDWPQRGARVGMPWLYSSCGHCDYCVRGDENLCPESETTGVTRDGGYAEFMVAPARYAAPIPDAIDLADAAPIMCAGITVFNGLRTGRFEPGVRDRVAVIGFGGLGHLAVQYVRALGGRAAVVSTSPQKEDKARETGAELFIDANRVDIGEALAGWEGGADVVLATAPAAEPMTAAISGLAPDGALVVLGVAEGEVSAAPHELVSFRRRVVGSPSGSRRGLRAALRVAAANNVRPDRTDVSLGDVADVFAKMHDSELSGRAVIRFE